MIRTSFHILLIIISCVSILYTLLWVFSYKSYPVEYGVSFNQHHAASLGLDWQETYLAILDELAPSYIRIAAMWSEVEPVPGQYNFDPVDWMMAEAAARDTKVLLVVGQKAPRWPECHVPMWSQELDADAYEASLLAYVTQVAERYKDHPALELWQVENEAFINFAFGECEGFREDLVTAELDIIRSIDSTREVVMTDSGELSTWRQPVKHGDILGTTMYRTVQTPKGRTITYDWLPPGFYKLKARIWGKSYHEFFVAELQAEPWFTDSDPLTTPLDIQQELFTPERMQENISYASHVGASRVYLWGVEWWYFMKQTHSVPEYWELYRILP